MAIEEKMNTTPSQPVSAKFIERVSANLLLSANRVSRPALHHNSATVDDALSRRSWSEKQADAAEKTQQMIADELRKNELRCRAEAMPIPQEMCGKRLKDGDW